MLVLWCWPTRTGTAPVSVFRVYPCVSEWLIEPLLCCRTARSEEKAPGAELIHNLALLSKHVYCAVTFMQHLARWDCCHCGARTLLQRLWLVEGPGGLTSGSPSNLRRSYMNSLRLHFLPFTFPPASSPPPCACPPPNPPSCCLSLTFLFYWSLADVGSETGGVIKEPDRSASSAQRFMECTRPRDGPNRASYCKQHAHLDSSRPRRRQSVDKLVLIKKRKFITTRCVCVCVCLWKM